VVVGSGVGAAYYLLVVLEREFGRLGGQKTYHDCYIFVVDAVVVDRWFEEVGVLFEPVEVLETFLPRRGSIADHFGMFKGAVSILSDFR